MRSIYGPGRLLLASKKPKIQQLIKQIDLLSIEEIQQLPEKPDVIKGLIEIKELGTEKGTNAELIASLMQRSHKDNIETDSNIYQYHGDTFWIKIRSTELKIETGWHWMEISSSEIIISSNKIQISDNNLEKLKGSSNLKKVGRLNDLLLLEKDRVSTLL